MVFLLLGVPGRPEIQVGDPGLGATEKHRLSFISCLCKTFSALQFLQGAFVMILQLFSGAKEGSKQLGGCF